MTPPDDVSTRLSEIRERVEAATEGPWRTVLGSGRHVMTAVRSEAEDKVVADCMPDWFYEIDSERRPDDHRDNMTFIAAARQDVPYLLSLVDGQREKLTELANAAHDVLSDMEHAEEWGHEAAQPSLDQSRERLQEKIAALRDAAQEGAE